MKLSILNVESILSANTNDNDIKNVLGVILDRANAVISLL
jgi:hypothetical protein